MNTTLAIKSPFTRPYPSKAQRRWSEMGYGMFLHFGPNTFAGIGWGDGKFPAAKFAPTALDTDQWARTASEAGMKYAVLTTKHHDGFCLWPTASTEYCVRRAPGRIDVVERFVDSCRKYGVEPGLYYSLWDRNCAFYDDDAQYADYMFGQIEELLTQYGDVVEMWFDGGWDKDHPTRNWPWNPDWLRTQDVAVLGGSRWRWRELYEHIHRLQPDCLVVNNSSSDRPGVVKSFPADIRTAEHFDFVWEGRICEPVLDSIHADADGRQHYLPLEFCTSLNPDWFFVPNKAYEHPTVETVAQWRQRAAEVGANLLLNVGPDTDGRLPDGNCRILIEAERMRRV